MPETFNILKIEHIGIAVNDLQKASMLLKLLGLSASKTKNIDSENVKVVKYSTSNNNHKIELLEATSMSSPISTFIKKRGEGVHHIALEVDNIENAIKYLKEKNIRLVYEDIRLGADNKLINFIHPDSCPGILIELCQQKKRD